MKNSNDTIGNRTRNLPACSTALQPTAPPRDPDCSISYFYKLRSNIKCATGCKLEQSNSDYLSIKQAYVATMLNLEIGEVAAMD
jgi:hypothetical protein